MWKLCLVSFIAVCLLPDTTLSQGFCGLCNPSCNVKIGGTERRLNFYNGAMYYFATDAVNAKTISWNDANSACTSLFQFTNGWPGLSGNLASFSNKEEFNFIVDKLESYSVYRSFIGGILDGSEWKWTDGTTMNKTLIEYGGKNNLWKGGRPSGDGKRMEILNHTSYRLNDLPQNLKFNSYVCKIPCSNGRPVLPEQCKPGKYNTLSEASRSTIKPKAPNCDGYRLDSVFGDVTSPSWVGPGWYKFANPAGTKMATSAPDGEKCGSASTGYMLDEHPTEIGQTKQVKFCFKWNGNPCNWETQGEVTKCGEGDFVYKLPNAPWCALRYCAVP